MGVFAEAVQLGGKERIVIWSLKKEQGRGGVFWKKLIEPCDRKTSILFTFFPHPFFVFVGAAKPNFIFLFEMICGFAACPVTQQVLQTVFPTNERSE